MGLVSFLRRAGNSDRGSVTDWKGEVGREVGGWFRRQGTGCNYG